MPVTGVIGIRCLPLGNREIQAVMLAEVLSVIIFRIQ